jgi:hypothetical protein
MKIICQIFFFLFLLSAYLFGQVQPQKPGAPNDLDNKYSPSNCQVFKNDSRSTGFNSSSSYGTNDFKNVIKCNLAMFPRKIAVFGYERLLNEHLGVEGWTGFVYGKDPIFSAIVSELDFSSGAGNSKISLHDIFQYGKHYTGGLYYGGAFRVNFESYFWSDASTFISFGVRGYSQKLYIDDYVKQYVISNNDKFEGSTIASVKQINYLLTLGYRFATEGKIATTHELYFSFALRNLTHTAYDSFQDNFGITTVRPTSTTASYNGFFMGMGYCFGIGFGK